MKFDTLIIYASIKPVPSPNHTRDATYGGSFQELYEVTSKTD
jgi:hypothetical protein